MRHTGKYEGVVAQMRSFGHTDRAFLQYAKKRPVVWAYRLRADMQNAQNMHVPEHVFMLYCRL